MVERGLSSFFNKCERLRAVDVGENERLSGIPSFETLPKTLATLKIGGCYRLTGAAMEAVKNRLIFGLSSWPTFVVFVVWNVELRSPQTSFSPFTDWKRRE